MRTLIFATGNKHKADEVQNFLGEGFALLCLKDVGITEDIPENEPTLEGNAYQKAKYVFDRTGEACFADDTGLEVEVLNGGPGVHTARYAGDGKSSEDNMALLLKNLEGVKNRRARFRTVIAYLDNNGRVFEFEGVVTGVITEKKSGTEGFGYDPIFRPDGYDKTFAELPLSEKNKISHRARAMQKFLEFLNE
ncbi:MAG: RdgB/HAM1 family non-canonical purine NTP pyrophosphatase [Paludibacteraceae bacterium]|nr:RdgB/HAM1 family non-canonical purine NTP pyrophosphatase [Paludibacteraceae bacterium]MBO7367589.1 RdgB/HAM1 family non-canonical purine NTP pyrophosphatase [Paludibacteraceae bacterium]